ncbi:nicotinate-nucleotide adenylyltransferase [Cognatiyoonia koreensis]|uniref:Probable nicotinate-nucleotide adenylyltransferase n=1 Tax=Cognatiyoonia koreensis TaxID=364200 RepID=A0A1I0MTY2_9RHOB|nr:nicotinate-nucleotide adenylyltransferase [Cognatiyoonia koreensis]SEV92208.1 nicotinate-nucleotide adenylyltransferase [Cognatiyoonia koreensis]
MLPRPNVRPYETIGLLGGSFDPPHQGHVAITKAALTLFQLDRIWWLVTPGNPLKSRQPAPMEDRLAAARRVMDHPRVQITDIETRLETTYTARTLQKLQAMYPKARFVWLMGADNLAQFDHWKDWEWIMQNVPIGVLARPGQRISGRTSKAANIYRHAQLPARAAGLLARAQAPAWCFLNVPMSDASSTAIRAKGAWGRSDT